MNTPALSEDALRPAGDAVVPTLGLAGFSYADLHDPLRLADLTAAFDAEVRSADAALFARYDAHRSGAALLGGPQESELLIDLAAHLSKFVGRLFAVEEPLRAIRDGAGREAPIFRVKRDFITRRAFRRNAPNRPSAADFAGLDAAAQPILTAAQRRDPRASTAGADRELLFALFIDTLLDAERTLSIRFDPHKPGALEAAPFAAFRTLAQALSLGLADLAAAGPLPEPAGQIAIELAALNGDAGPADLAVVKKVLDLFDRWAFAAKLSPEGRHRTHHWVLLRLPQPIDYQNLVPLRRPRADLPEAIEGHQEHQRRRDGFKLTDQRFDPREVRSEIDYCLYCHERSKDTCRTGFAAAPAATSDAAPPYKKNALGIPLTGCPLEERISEAHAIAKEGDVLAGLALVSIDNPMAPGTGHRICNDCMKACIYQKQDPVNIPQIETRLLTDVLGLRFGYEIWSLLTRWNPLKCAPGQRQHPRPYSGLNVLVVGLGPAGYTLAHHLLNEGFGVVGIDGLKIEPLPDDLVGRRRGRQTVPRAVEWAGKQFGAELDQRITSGFGGVSEYGITVRWDKSFLDILHLNLARRSTFRIYGGIRFGGTLTAEDAWSLGFHHVAIAAGAGKPTLIPLEGNLMRGVRKASDFLMALQLSGAFKKTALANLQVRLPAVVIGGGLTAIDTATELAAYYPVQVEKLLERHDALASDFGGEARLLALFDAEEREVYTEMLAHGRAVRAERERAAAAAEAPDFASLIKGWGGVTIAYRKGLQDSPAYRLNHEEVIKCLEEGIVFAEGMSPKAAIADQHGAVKTVRFAKQKLEGGKWKDAGEAVDLPARSLCVAAGTSPNITYEKEAPGSFVLDPQHGSFKSHRLERAADGAISLVPAEVTEDLSGRPGFFTSYQRDGKLISYFGDNHPTYAGSVVKAMASAKDGYPQIAALFAPQLAELDRIVASKEPERSLELDRLEMAGWAFANKIDLELASTVHAVNRLTPTIVEVVVHAPAAARRFEPGQFYRLQDFESHARQVDGTRLQMEGIALTGAWTDPDKGLLGLIVLELGASSRLCAALQPGQAVVVMGPTGAPSTIPKSEDVVLCGGGLGNAVLFSIGKALKANGCRVIYFAGYRNAQDVFKRDEIEAGTDVVVWAVDRGTTPPQPRRSQDKTFSGNMVEAMVAYASGALGETPVPFANVRRIIAIGSDRMMAAVTAARHGVLKSFLPPDHVGIASINSPMQCMMKEICAQCLQKHRDPVTGKETVVFTCFDQDQPMDRVDWENLRARLRANSLQEKLSALWLDRLLRRGHVQRI